MVKYCDGFTCKKKKRRTRAYRYVQNGTAAAQRVPLTAAQRERGVVSGYSNSKLPGWAQAGYTSFIDWANNSSAGKAMTAMRNKIGLSQAAKKYIPGYEGASDFAEGVQSKDYWKAALGLGTAAYGVGTFFAPELKVGNLAKAAFARTAVGRAVNRLGTTLGNAALGQGKKMFTEASRGISKGLAGPMAAARFLKHGYDTRNFPPNSMSYWLKGQGTPKLHAPPLDQYNLYSTYGRGIDVSKLTFQNVPQYMVPENLPPKANKWAMESFKEDLKHFAPPHGGQHYVSKVAGGPSISHHDQKLKHQYAKEWYNGPAIPELRSIPFDISKETGSQRKPNLAKDKKIKLFNDKGEFM